jgi:predicted PurR-regulated permease PerM
MFFSDMWFYVIATLLIAAGLAYNSFVAYMERTGRDRGYNALLVVLLSLLIIGAISIYLGWETALIVFIFFCCGGLPCVFGSIARFQSQREKEEREDRNTLKETLRHGDSA